MRDFKSVVEVSLQLWNGIRVLFRVMMLLIRAATNATSENRKFRIDCSITTKGN